MSSEQEQQINKLMNKLRIECITKIQEKAKLFDSSAERHSIEAVKTMDDEHIRRARTSVAEKEGCHYLEGEAITIINSTWPHMNGLLETIKAESEAEDE